MPTDPDDMSAPVTRGELREELAATKTELRAEIGAWLAAFEIRLEQRLEQKLEQKFDDKLGLWGGALLDRMDRLGRDLRSEMAELYRRLSAELASHTRASYEEARAQINVIDEKYEDLPERVKRLEEHVLPEPGPKGPAGSRG